MPLIGSLLERVGGYKPPQKTHQLYMSQ